VLARAAPMTPARGAAEGGGEGAYEPPKLFRAGRRSGWRWFVRLRFGAGSGAEALVAVSPRLWL